ncbi:MAG TPA: tetratricopeptide repeat protein [Vicinamibacterales bacterium]|nr:tetratricopeptide repeat protein [Vicinamibacterales bacterium]
MKRLERHKLKENEFARTVARAQEILVSRQRDITVMGLVVVVLLGAVAGYVWWRQARNANATEMLATALAIYQAPVVALPEPAPGSPIPVQQPGTYVTERAKLDAALPRFLEAADRYPDTDAGITARYYSAAILASLGRHAEAEQRYQEVLEHAGSGIYSRTARLGLADALVEQGKYDSAINHYTEMSRDPDAQLPLDGVLMQLGRAYARAGRKEEARRAFTRVVEEFPQSLYVADARRELEEQKEPS